MQVIILVFVFAAAMVLLAGVEIFFALLITALLAFAFMAGGVLLLCALINPLLGARLVSSAKAGLCRLARLQFGLRPLWGYVVHPRHRHKLVYEKTKLAKAVAVQLESLHSRNLWAAIVVHSLFVVLLALAIRQEVELVVAASILFLYVLLFSAVMVSIIIKIPFVVRVWSSPGVRLAIYVLPAFVIYISRGYASAWVGDILEVSPVNVPFAYGAATVFVAAFFLSIFLLSAVFIFEILMLVTLFLPREAVGSEAKRLELIFLWSIFFIASYATVVTVMRLPSDSLGRLLVTAAAYRFDSAPANFCDLTNDEAIAARKEEPQIMAIFLSAAQQRAVLFQVPMPLLKPVSIYHFDKESKNFPWPKAIRVVECFKPDQRRIAPDLRLMP